MAVRGKWVIQLDKISNETVIHNYILEHTDFRVKIDSFKNFKTSDYLSLPLNFNIDSLKKSVEEAIDIYGLHAFSYQGHKTEENAYISASLTYNPDAIDKISDNPHEATLGSTSMGYGSASLYSKELSKRNTYTDSMSFVVRTPFSLHGEIKNLLDSFQRTLVRSRVSVLKGSREEAKKFNFGWHNDELVFTNLRVNIPVISSPDFVIQVISGMTDDQIQITEFGLEPGKAYVYDTNKNHRPTVKKTTDANRVNLICGVSPWFDFDKENKVWISNEYYGELHPFEMFSQGYISNLIKE